MNIFDAKRKQYDKAAGSSGPLKEFRGGGVPIAHESVTVVAKPKPGQNLSPEQLKDKVAKMGVLPRVEEMLPDMLEDSEDDLEELRRQSEEADEKRKRGG